MSPTLQADSLPSEASENQWLKKKKKVLTLSGETSKHTIPLSRVEHLCSCLLNLHLQFNEICGIILKRNRFKRKHSTRGKYKPIHTTSLITFALIAWKTVYPVLYCSRHLIGRVSPSDWNPWACFNVSLLLKHYFARVWDECNCAVVWTFFSIAFLWDWNENGPFQVLWPLLSFPNLLAYWVQHFHSIIF